MAASPRINIKLPESVLSDLELYAKGLGSTVAGEATRLLTNVILEMKEEGKIPRPTNQSSVEQYLKMLASEEAIPDEIIQLLAKETELTEEELRKLRDRLLP